MNKHTARLALWAMIAAMVFVPLSAWASSGATDFDTYARATANKTNVLVDVFSYVSYFIGAVFAALGISELRRVVDGSGGGQIAVRQPLAKLGIGGLFLSLPFATAVLQNVMTGDETWRFTPLNVYRFGSMNIQEDGLSGFIANGIFNVGVLVDVANIAAYIIGVFFVMRGLQILRQHIDNPAQVQLADALKRLATGGALFSMPFIVHVVRHTFGMQKTGAGIAATGWNASQTSEGLDGMMLNFVGDIVNPSLYAIEIFCFVAGVVMILFAMQRMVKSAQDGPRGPLGAGTIAMFVIAGLLISFPQLVEALNLSITGNASALTQVKFMSESGANEELNQSAVNVISGTLAFMAVVGFLSIVRGLFLLKTLSEGGQATLMQVAVHLVAGALCVNLGALLNAVQTTLGIGNFPVTFS